MIFNEEANLTRITSNLHVIPIIHLYLIEFSKYLNMVNYLITDLL